MRTKMFAVSMLEKVEVIRRLRIAKRLYGNGDWEEIK